MNEQESWNKRFEMSLAEIYMELPDGHRAKKDYEALIAEPRGKIVEMSMRLDELEETVRELKLKAPNLCPPRPAPQPRLIEAVEKLVEFYNKYPRVCYDGEGDLLDTLRLALAAERKRQSELEPLLRHVVLWYNRKVNKENGADEILIHNVANYLRHTTHLDALDKGAV